MVLVLEYSVEVVDIGVSVGYFSCVDVVLVVLLVKVYVVLVELVVVMLIVGGLGDLDELC